MLAHCALWRFHCCVVRRKIPICHWGGAKWFHHCVVVIAHFHSGSFCLRFCFTCRLLRQREVEKKTWKFFWHINLSLCFFHSLFLSNLHISWVPIEPIVQKRRSMWPSPLQWVCTINWLIKGHAHGEKCRSVCVCLECICKDPACTNCNTYTTFSFLSMTLSQP